jgi:hypothetical protein
MLRGCGHVDVSWPARSDNFHDSTRFRGAHVGRLRGGCGAWRVAAAAAAAAAAVGGGVWETEGRRIMKEDSICAR